MPPNLSKINLFYIIIAHNTFHPASCSVHVCALDVYPKLASRAVTTKKSNITVPLVGACSFLPHCNGKHIWSLHSTCKLGH